MYVHIFHATLYTSYVNFSSEFCGFFSLRGFSSSVSPWDASVHRNATEKQMFWRSREGAIFSWGEFLHSIVVGGSILFFFFFLHFLAKDAPLYAGIVRLLLRGWTTRNGGWFRSSSRYSAGLLMTFLFGLSCTYFAWGLNSYLIYLRTSLIPNHKKKRIFSTSWGSCCRNSFKCCRKWRNGRWMKKLTLIISIASRFFRFWAKFVWTRHIQRRDIAPSRGRDFFLFFFILLETRRHSPRHHSS